MHTNFVYVFQPFKCQCGVYSTLWSLRTAVIPPPLKLEFYSLKSERAKFPSGRSITRGYLISIEKQQFLNSLLAVSNSSLFSRIKNLYNHQTDEILNCDWLFLFSSDVCKFWTGTRVFICLTSAQIGTSLVLSFRPPESL